MEDTVLAACALTAQDCELKAGQNDLYHFAQVKS